MTEPPRMPLPVSAAPTLLMAMDLVDKILVTEPGIPNPDVLAFVANIENSGRAADVAMTLAGLLARALGDPDIAPPGTPAAMIREHAMARWEEMKMFYLQAASRDITPDDQL